MTPADPNRPEALNAADLALLVDDLRGELGAREAQRLSDRLGREPGLALERVRLGGLLRAESTRFAAEAEIAREDAPRLAAFIVSRVRADEAAERSRQRHAGSKRRRMARILAASIGLHVVLIGALTWQIRRAARDPAQTLLAVTYEPFPEAYERLPDDAVGDRIAQALDDMPADELERLPSEVIAFDGELDPELEPELDDVVRHAGFSPSFQFPRGTGLQLSRRGNEALKRKRLQALGFDADGTLSKVRLGLSYLRSQQRADGSFAPEAGHSAVHDTALAMLAFLGDGRHSKLAGEQGQPVRRGISWLRSALLGSDAPASVAAGDRSIALVALSEDFMLSYGRLGVTEARKRGTEIRRLAVVVQAAMSPAAGATGPDIAAEGDGLWRVWALHAAQQTGVTPHTRAQQARFQTWLATAARPGVGPLALEPLAILARGTALLASERGARKPRFSSWRDATADDLLAGLLPNGKAKGSGSGARLNQTALLLLALQTAYRTY